MARLDYEHRNRRLRPPDPALITSGRDRSITPKQRTFIEALAEQAGVEPLPVTTRAGASALIKRLQRQIVEQEPDAKHSGSSPPVKLRAERGGQPPAGGRE